MKYTIFKLPIYIYIFPVDYGFYLFHKLLFNMFYMSGTHRMRQCLIKTLSFSPDAYKLVKERKRERQK